MQKNIANIKQLTDTKKKLEQEELIKKLQKSRSPKSKRSPRMYHSTGILKLPPGQKHSAASLLRK